MSHYKLEKAKLDEFLEFMKEKYSVWAPVRADEGWAFAPVEGAVTLEHYLLTRLSAKQFVTPLYETLISFDGPEGEPAPPDKEARLVFGVRPCDAGAVRLMDRVYLEGRYRDPLYKARRENTVLVVLACGEPAPTCFCTSTGGGPADDTGADIMAYGNDGHWILKGVTEKGKNVLTGGGPAKACKDKLPEDKAAGKIPVLWDLAQAQKAVKEQFENPVWESMAQRCLACGVCTYVCPSCSCFDVSDEAKRGKGKRLRFWDGCMFPLFTHHAGGHNPRESRGPRYRQRVLHKFNYFPHRNEGANLCVGCGRCVVDCPVNIDIREAVRKTLEPGGSHDK